MKMKILAIAALIAIFSSCGKKQNSETTEQPLDSAVVSEQVADTTSALPEPESEKTPEIATSGFEKLQGKWQHIDDSTNFLVFEGNLRKEQAAGEEWDETEFTVYEDSTLQASDDMEWEIVGMTDEYLELVYSARGNTLTYKRVK